MLAAPRAPLRQKHERPLARAFKFLAERAGFEPALGY